MEKLMSIVHWVAYAYYVYVFGYASLFKIFQKPSMMQSMQSLGFNKTWTIWIGVAETIGLLAVLGGIFEPRIKTIGILFLFPFAVGAFTAHMAHQEYEHFYQSLFMCILSVVLLWTDARFKMLI